MNRRTRVFQLIKHLDRGGAEVLMSEVFRCSDHERFKFGFGYFMEGRNTLEAELVEQGADVVCFRAGTPARMMSVVGDVARHLRAWGADLLHCHLPLPGVVGRLAAQLAGVPVVYTEHNVIEKYHPLTRGANLVTWRMQGHVIAVSSEVGASIRRHADDSVPLAVVKNAVSVDRFVRDDVAAARVRAAHGIPPDAPVVGTVAVFRKAKRLDHWFAAARGIVDAIPSAHFLVVGFGPLEDEVRAAVARLGLGARVHLAGAQVDVRPFLSAMDVYMMSSAYEGLPVALLEAMSTGLPVVSTAVGGIAETVISGEHGFLVDVDRTDELAGLAAKLLQDPATRARFGAAARRRVEELFGMRRMVSEIEDVYARVLDESSRAAA